MIAASPAEWGIAIGTGAPGIGAMVAAIVAAARARGADVKAGEAVRRLTVPGNNGTIGEAVGKATDAAQGAQATVVESHQLVRETHDRIAELTPVPDALRDVARILSLAEPFMQLWREHHPEGPLGGGTS